MALVVGTTHYIPTFNPGSNANQQSVLRLVNPQEEDVDVTIRGFDDRNEASGTVSLTLAAGHAIRVTAAELEDGPAGSQASGALGDGSGKWRLFVQAVQPILAMSLLEDPNSYLTNLSASRKMEGQLANILVGLNLGEDPDPNPIDDVDLTVPGQCATEVDVCVRDDQCVDGDEVKITINDDVAFEGELFGTWQCEVASVREGSNSVVFLALNGTGFKGNCTTTNVNTGQLRITARGGDENLQNWRHAGGRGSEADLTITVGARSNENCTLPSELDDHSDTISDATVLTPGSSEEGELTSGDLDVFRVDVDGSGTLTVYTTGDIDTVGRLLDGAGGLLSENDDDGKGRNFRIERQVDAGTFYVEVRPFSSGGSYTVHADFDDGSSSAADP